MLGLILSHMAKAVCGDALGPSEMGEIMDGDEWEAINSALAVESDGESPGGESDDSGSDDDSDENSVGPGEMTEQTVAPLLEVPQSDTIIPIGPQSDTVIPDGDGIIIMKNKKVNTNPLPSSNPPPIVLTAQQSEASLKLNEKLKNHTAILVGEPGVGKTHCIAHSLVDQFVIGGSPSEALMKQWSDFTIQIGQPAVILHGTNIETQLADAIKLARNGTKFSAFTTYQTAFSRSKTVLNAMKEILEANELVPSEKLVPSKSGWDKELKRHSLSEPVYKLLSSQSFELTVADLSDAMGEFVVVSDEFDPQFRGSATAEGHELVTKVMFSAWLICAAAHPSAKKHVLASATPIRKRFKPSVTSLLMMMYGVSPHNLKDGTPASGLITASNLPHGLNEVDAGAATTAGGEKYERDVKTAIENSTVRLELPPELPSGIDSVRVRRVQTPYVLDGPDKGENGREQTVLNQMKDTAEKLGEVLRKLTYLRKGIPSGPMTRKKKEKLDQQKALTLASIQLKQRLLLLEMSGLNGGFQLTTPIVQMILIYLQRVFTLSKSTVRSFWAQFKEAPSEVAFVSDFINSVYADADSTFPDRENTLLRRVDKSKAWTKPVKPDDDDDDATAAYEKKMASWNITLKKRILQLLMKYGTIVEDRTEILVPHGLNADGNDPLSSKIVYTIADMVKSEIDAKKASPDGGPPSAVVSFSVHFLRMLHKRLVELGVPTKEIGWAAEGNAAKVAKKWLSSDYRVVLMSETSVASGLNLPAAIVHICGLPTSYSAFKQLIWRFFRRLGNVYRHPSGQLRPIPPHPDGYTCLINVHTRDGVGPLLSTLGGLMKGEDYRGADAAIGSPDCVLEKLKVNDPSFDQFVAAGIKLAEACGQSIDQTKATIAAKVAAKADKKADVRSKRKHVPDEKLAGKQKRKRAPDGVKGRKRKRGKKFHGQIVLE